MSDATSLSYLDAARSLGVPLRVLRRAIRDGRVPAPPAGGALAKVPHEWISHAQVAIAATPHALSRSPHQKVPPFARYEGTSCWRKYRSRGREYGRYLAHAAKL